MDAKRLDNRPWNDPAGNQEPAPCSTTHKKRNQQNEYAGSRNNHQTSPEKSEYLSEILNDSLKNTQVIADFPAVMFPESPALNITPEEENAAFWNSPSAQSQKTT